MGSAQALTSSGWSANYYSFGEIASQTGSYEDTHFDYTGQERDRGTGLMYFGARYYDPGIGRWLSVDPKSFPSWSSYNFCFNNSIKYFDHDGESGKDITKFIMAIDGKYRYFWGGKHPNDELISTTTKENIDNMSKMLYTAQTTYAQLGIEGCDLGYDCSGLLIAANDANPDRSYNLASEIAKMKGPGSKRLWDFFNNHSEYKKITDRNQLSEGDFIVQKEGGHVALVVRDPNSGELVIAEAWKTGTSVGTDNRSFQSFAIGTEYYGFHDIGNDSWRALIRDVVHTIKDIFEPSKGWAAEHGGSPR